MLRFSSVAGASLIALLAFGVTAAMAEDKPQNKAPVTLRADPSCPSNCEPDSNLPGYDIEIAKRIYGLAGYAVDYKLLSWSRAVIEVRKGAEDAIVAGIKADAPDFIFPEEPSGKLSNMCATIKGSGWHWDGPQSLEGKVLGTIPNYQYWPELKAYIDAHANDTKRVRPMAMMHAQDLNLKLLAVGRLDVVCDDIGSLVYHIKSVGLTDKLDVSGPYGAEEFQYIGFSPNSGRGAELAAIWDSGIRKMRANGELHKILDRYGLKDWK